MIALKNIVTGASVAVIALGASRVVARASVGPGTECMLRFSSDAQADCYRRLFSKRLETRGVAEAVGLLDRLAAADRGVSRRAHEFAHGIGIEAYALFPDIATTFVACGDGSASGCRHGIIQGYFEAQDRGTTPDVESFCQPFKGPDATRWVLFQCVHGMGHGLTMFHDHDLPRALSDCDRLSDGWDRESCYGGAFMESDVNAIAPHHPASELSAASHHHHSTFKAIDPNDPLYPCSISAERHWRACYEIQTAVMLYLNGGDIADAARSCDRAPVSMRGACYQSLGRDITAYALRDSEKSARLCAKGSEEYRPWCYVGVAKSFIDWTATIDNALDFCRLVAPNGAAGASACYQAIGEQVLSLSSDAKHHESECARAASAEGVAACRRGARLP